MKSFTTLKSLATNLSNNTSTANDTLMGQLINDQHRYLLQKYFSNEGSFSITTIGAQSLTATVSLSVSATSCTLTSGWGYHSTFAYITFSNGDVRYASFIAGSTAVVWTGGLSATATTALDVGGVQFYPAPPNFSKLKTVTIMIGNLKWTPTEILTRQDWDNLNVFPYYADIPNNFYVYPGGDKGVQIGIWPIPSTTGNLITYSYKFRVPDLSLADYIAGTISITNGSTSFTGAGTTFVPTTNAQLESRWLQIAQPIGDNLWYQISGISSTTAGTLYQPYQGITVSGGTFTIGQMPIIMEDFQDMMVYGALMQYYSNIKPDKLSYQQNQLEYSKRLELLEEYSGSNTINVNLRRNFNQMNPNLFPQDIG